MFKKLLLTLSALTMLMAGSAFAGDANWSFYGVAHSSINMLNNGEDSQIGLSSNTSRFGFKGSTAVNEDFTAFWQFESLVDFAGTAASTTIGGRNTFVGLKHATAGKFVFGRHDSPFKALGRKVEMFPDQLGDFRAVSHSILGYDDDDEQIAWGWDERLSEIAAWVSPDWSGFSIFAAYMFDQGFAGADNAATALSGMASYTADQFMLGAAYETYSEAYAMDEDSDGPKAVRFVGKYMGEQFELGGLFQNSTMWEDFSQSLMGLGANFHVNDKWNVKGAFFMMNQYTDAEDIEGGDIDESDVNVNMIAFGVERVFSENVLMYAQFATLSHGDNAEPVELGGGQSGFGGGIAPALTVDEDGMIQNPNGFSVGTVINW